MAIPQNNFVKYALLGFTGLTACFVAGLSLGAFKASVSDVFAALIGQHADNQLTMLIQSIRLPRVLGAMLIGACLALAGTTFQSLFRNPLVSPDILAVSSGAALGAISAMAAGYDGIVMQLSAFAGGLIAVSLVTLFASILNMGSSLTLLLAGVVLSALFSAGVSIIQMLANTQTVLPGIVFWLLGSLSNLTMKDVGWLSAAYIAGFIIIFSQHRALDKLALGEATAFSLGVNLKKTRMLCILAATIITAATVATAGIIGWIGLVVPHMVRFVAGPSVKINLLFASLLGAGLLSLIDTLARSSLGVEIPIGVATAFIGVPLFVFTLVKTRRQI
jgi:iron complex transport system permease protein